MVNSNELGRSSEEQLSPREFRNATRKIFLKYASVANQALHPMVEEGQGRLSLGSVPGRINEEQFVVDAMGESILTSLIRDSRLPAFVLGEHNINDYSDGNPKVVFAIDPFDNTSEYQRGLDTPVYSVLGAYNPDGSPIGSVIVDIRGQKSYVSIRKVNRIEDLSSTDTHRKEIETPKARTSIKDDGLTIATYLGSNEYNLKFFDNFRDLVEDMSKKGRLYGNGGSFIYAFLATGAVDAYIMFDEPHSEILPGLPLALAAGCTAVSVNLVDGSFKEYKFDPEFINNPERYTHETVDLFIAARSPELRDEIVQYYLRGEGLRKPDSL